MAVVKEPWLARLGHDPCGSLPSRSAPGERRPVGGLQLIRRGAPWVERRKVGEQRRQSPDDSRAQPRSRFTGAAANASVRMTLTFNRQSGRRRPATLRAHRFKLLRAADPLGGAAADRKLMSLPAPFAAKGWQFDYQAVSANRVFKLLGLQLPGAPRLTGSECVLIRNAY